MFQIEVDFLFPPVSVSLLVSGLPQHLVPEAEDAGYSEGEEESAETGVEEAETRWARRVQTPLQCILASSVCVFVSMFRCRQEVGCLWILLRADKKACGSWYVFEKGKCFHCFGLAWPNMSHSTRTKVVVCFFLNYAKKAIDSGNVPFKRRRLA